MPRKARIEIALFIFCLFALLLIDFVIEYDDRLDPVVFFNFTGMVIYFISFVAILRRNVSFVGLISGFMVYTGSFACTTTFIYSLTLDESLYTRMWIAAYAFFGVFGGIRTYRAWLKHRPVKERKL